MSILPTTVEEIREYRTFISSTEGMSQNAREWIESYEKVSFKSC